MELKATGERKLLASTVQLAGSAADVFPLLCPVREYDWIRYWECQLIHTESGVIEPDAIFTTDLNGESHEVWTVTEHDSEKYRIEFIRVRVDLTVIRHRIALTELSDKSCEMYWEHLVTGLTDEGNEWLQNRSEADFEKEVARLAVLLDFYLKHGRAAEMSDVLPEIKARLGRN